MFALFRKLAASLGCSCCSDKKHLVIDPFFMAKILTQKSTVFFIFKCQCTCIFIIKNYNSVFCSLLIEYTKCKQIHFGLNAFCELENDFFY